MYAQFLTHADFQLFKPHQLARKLNSKMQPIIWVCTNQPKTFIVTNEWIIVQVMEQSSNSHSRDLLNFNIQNLSQSRCSIPPK